MFMTNAINNFTYWCSGFIREGNSCLVTPRFFIFDHNFRYVVYCAHFYVVTSDLERQKHDICVRLTLKKSVRLRALVCVCVCVCVLAAVESTLSS